MAITLSGSGIVAGNISDGAVTAAKIASGAARANFGAGAVLQVVQGTNATSVQTSSNNPAYIASNISATITPTSATSKILVMITARVYIGSPTTGESGMGFAIYRNGSSVFQDASGYMGRYYNHASNSYVSNHRDTNFISYLDSPASTSAQTYVFRFNSYLGVSGVNVDGQTSTIQLLEIAA